MSFYPDFLLSSHYIIHLIWQNFQNPIFVSWFPFLQQGFTCFFFTNKALIVHEDIFASLRTKSSCKRKKSSFTSNSIKCKRLFSWPNLNEEALILSRVFSFLKFNTSLKIFKACLGCYSRRIWVTKFKSESQWRS